MQKLLITSERFRLSDKPIYKSHEKDQLAGFMRLQARIYAERATKAGYDVHIATNYSFFGYKTIPDSELKYSDFDKVIMLYCRGNLIAGILNPVQKAQVRALSDKSFKGQLYIYYDDAKNPPQNLGKVLYQKIERNQIRDQDKDLVTEDLAKYIYDLFDSDQTHLLIPGGNLPYNEDRSLAIINTTQVDDSYQNYFAGRELAGNKLFEEPLDISELDCDVIYAGVDRKHRIEVLSPIFQSERIKTRAHIRIEKRNGDLYQKNLLSFKNHENLPLFPYEESADRHARSLVQPIVGDKWQDGNFVSLRWWSTLSYPSIPAIHISYDPNKSLIVDKTLKSEIYWETEEDLFEIVEKAKSSYGYRQDIINLARLEKPQTSWNELQFQ